MPLSETAWADVKNFTGKHWDYIYIRSSNGFNVHNPYQSIVRYSYHYSLAVDWTDTSITIDRQIDVNPGGNYKDDSLPFIVFEAIDVQTYPISTVTCIKGEFTLCMDKHALLTVTP